VFHGGVVHLGVCLVAYHSFDLVDWDVIKVLHNLLMLGQQFLFYWYVALHLILLLGGVVHLIHVIEVFIWMLPLGLGSIHNLIARTLKRLKHLAIILLLLGIVKALLGVVLNCLLQHVDFS